VGPVICYPMCIAYCLVGEGGRLSGVGHRGVVCQYSFGILNLGPASDTWDQDSLGS
jgi:hypothetical protein